jgi:hypothetical protein
MQALSDHFFILLIKSQHKPNATLTFTAAAILAKRVAWRTPAGVAAPSVAAGARVTRVGALGALVNVCTNDPVILHDLKKDNYMNRNTNLFQ